MEKTKEIKKPDPSQQWTNKSHSNDARPKITSQKIQKRKKKDQWGKKKKTLTLGGKAYWAPRKKPEKGAGASADNLEIETKFGRAIPKPG